MEEEHDVCYRRCVAEKKEGGWKQSTKAGKIITELEEKLDKK